MKKIQHKLVLSYALIALLSIVLVAGPYRLAIVRG